MDKTEMILESLTKILKRAGSRLTAFGVGLCSAFVCHLAWANNAMKVDGVFAVGKDGQAIYKVPIKIPTVPEEIGISLALTYSSQAGLGNAGKGWDIAGLSMITRCPLTVAQDGVSDLQLDSPDPTYCLDGQRLILDRTSITYSGQNYKHEFEKFSSVRALITSSSDRAVTEFTVNTKNGFTLIYRGMANAEGELWWWPLSEVRNRYDTYFLIDYTLYDNSPRPDVIRRDEVLVKFNYATVAGTAFPSRYLDGVGSLRQTYLSSIQAFKVPSRVSVHKQYKLTYSVDPATRLPNLQTLQECSGSCLPPLVFTYATETPRFTSTIESPVLDWGASDGRAWVDLNGDGRADFCRVVGSIGVSRLACTLSTSTGFGNTLTSEVLDVGIEISRKWTDVNADGFADFCRVTGTPAAYRLMCTLGSVSGFGPTVSGVVDVGSEMQNAKWYDVRDDGKMRYCRYNFAAQFRCAVLTGDTFAEESGIGGSGTGKFDLVNLFGKGRPYRCSHQPNKFGCSRITEGAHVNQIAANIYPGFWADFNGDGYVDYCQATGNAPTATMQCGVSTGSEFHGMGVVAAENVMSGLTGNAKWIDVNADGTEDYCRVIGAAGNYKAACSFSDGWIFRNALESDVLDPGQESGQDWVDVQGNQSKAFCRVLGAVNMFDSRAACTLFAVPGAGRLTRIDNGIGSTIQIAYKPLTDSAVYEKGVGAIYPFMDVQSPIHLVSQVDFSNGRGGFISTGYRYGGALKDLTGRGSLGVRWMESISLASGVVTRTTYRQDIPFAGLPIQTIISLPGRGNSGVLSDVTNEYGCNDFVSVGGCVVVAGGRYFPYLTSTVSKRWDLNGAPLPTITTTQQFDAGGNIIKSQRTASDGISVEEVHTYKATPGKSGVRGLIEKSVVTKSAPVN